ncbi:hypothetical protein FB45DRAFT_1093989 [Roridomyces roridus]|uniref:F-box domain-containing protein n=1 Tax=Roridomyces roridus TaxID=1738132 RepID=A0AAD7FI36_9AGAR|nr:hypothetical protein FB45DRAFT_1093989 [Roridomyces roridus]
MASRDSDLSTQLVTGSSEPRAGRSKAIGEWCAAVTIRHDCPSSMSSTPGDLGNTEPTSLTPASGVPHIRILSYDVLINIFHLVVGDNPRALSLIIACVCKQWRTAVYQQPSLWSTFVVNFFGGPPAVKLIELHFEKSRDSPLSLRLISTLDQTRHSEQIERILTLLAANAQRIYALSFVGYTWARIDLSVLRGRLSQLEVLHFIDAAPLYTFSVTAFTPTCHFDIAPKLRVLRIAGLDLEGCSQKSIDLSNLAFLTVILFALDDSRGTSSHHTAGEQILPRLTCWQFVRLEKYGQDEVVCRLLDRHTAPELGRLDIACLAAPARLEALLARSQCPLTHLALRHCRVRVGELLDILKQTPGLECLVIEHGLIPTMITDRFFEGLTLRNGAGLVPKLAKLRIVGHYFFREAAMLEMMESRDRAVLKDVELVSPVSAVQELRRLKPSIDERVCLEFWNVVRKMS